MVFYLGDEVRSSRVYVTGSGILGVMEVHGRNLDFHII